MKKREFDNQAELNYDLSWENIKNTDYAETEEYLMFARNNTFTKRLYKGTLYDIMRLDG